MGELARALRDGDPAALRHESADVLAWLGSLANLAGVDLEAAVARYADGLPSLRGEALRLRASLKFAKNSRVGATVRDRFVPIAFEESVGQNPGRRQSAPFGKRTDDQKRPGFVPGRGRRGDAGTLRRPLLCGLRPPWGARGSLDCGVSGA